MGAIGNCMNQPLFRLANSTNSLEFQDFLKALKHRCVVKENEPVYLVCDNASAHHTNDVKQLTARLGFKALYMPAYTPEVNSIEVSNLNVLLIDYSDCGVS